MPKIVILICVLLLMLTDITPGQGNEFIKPDIDAQPTIGFPPLAVHFNCNNLEDRLQTAVEILWDFGDGTTSRALYPTHIYEKTGKYAVTVHYTSSGIPGTQIFKNLIQVYSPEEQAGMLKLAIVDASHTWFKEGWDNLIDDDTFGANGTVSAGQDFPWVVLQFDDQNIRAINKIRMLIDTGIGHYSHWTRKFHLEASTTGVYESDFTPFFAYDDKKSGWETFEFPTVDLKYLKLVIDQPTGAFRQVGELHVYEPVPLLDLKNSSFSLHPPFIASGIDSCVVMINLADSTGHPVSGLPASAFHLAVWGGENFCSDIKETTSPGLYRGKFSSFEAGDKPVEVRVYGNLISADAPNRVTFATPLLEKVALEVVDGTKCYEGMSWDNAIDGDFAGDDGTTMAGPLYEDAWVIFKIQDDAAKTVNQFRFLADSGHRYPQDWIKEFKILVSGTKLLADSFKVVYQGLKDGGDWESIFIKPTPVKYIKIIIPKPRKWKVLGEFEVYALNKTIGARSLREERRTSKTIAAEYNQPVQFALYQNYPNPFSINGISQSGTIIRYQLPEASRVTFSIFNMLGQEISQLVQENQVAGYHELRWNGDRGTNRKISAGTYFYRLLAEQNGKKFQKVMKMVVVH